MVGPTKQGLGFNNCYNKTKNNPHLKEPYENYRNYYFT